MALTASKMLPLGTTAPSFNLLNVVTDQSESLRTHSGPKGTIVIFMCNHCPYVVHLLDVIIKKAADWKAEGIHTIGISSNSVLTHPQDGPDKMKVLALEKSFNFPYLYDPEQKVAQAYDAACTPDFYLFDVKLKLHYRGQFDAARPGNNEKITGIDLDKAVNNMLQNKSPLPSQKPSMGCNIKWIPGHEPDGWDL